MGGRWVSGGWVGGFGSRIKPLYGSILQAESCQILSLAENPRWIRVWQHSKSALLHTLQKEHFQDIFCINKNKWVTHVLFFYSSQILTHLQSCLITKSSSQPASHSRRYSHTQLIPVPRVRIAVMEGGMECIVLLLGSWAHIANRLCSKQR